MRWSSKLIGFGFLFVLGLILAFAPVDRAGHITPDTADLVNELQHRNYYISADDLAHSIIDKESGFVVVDVRGKEDFEKYHIPGSVNIPVTELLNNEYLREAAQNNTIILTSNGNTLASQAWLLLKQRGFKDVYILGGGMNYWVEAFGNPRKPTGAYTDDELFRYEFRKAAAPVMMGANIGATGTEAQKPKISKPVIRVRNNKKKQFDEGC